jgi:hypothetical protein
MLSNEVMSKEIDRLDDESAELRDKAINALSDLISARLLFNAYTNQVETGDPQDPMQYDMSADGCVMTYAGDISREVAHLVPELVKERMADFMYRHLLASHEFRPGDRMEWADGAKQRAVVEGFVAGGRIRVKFFYDDESEETMDVNRKFLIGILSGGTWKLLPRDAEPAVGTSLDLTARPLMLTNIQPGTQVIFKKPDHVLRIHHQNADKTWSCSISYEGAGTGQFCSRDYSEDQLIRFEDEWKIASIHRPASPDLAPIWRWKAIDAGMYYQSIKKGSMLVIQNIGSDEWDVVVWEEGQENLGVMNSQYSEEIQKWLDDREMRIVLEVPPETIMRVKNGKFLNTLILCA